MTWIMERDSDLLTCEIRRSPDADVYEFEMAPLSGTTETRTFSSATELIDQYLLQQSTLRALGWRPRLMPIAA